MHIHVHVFVRASVPYLYVGPLICYVTFAHAVCQQYAICLYVSLSVWMSDGPDGRRLWHDDFFGRCVYVSCLLVKQSRRVAAAAPKRRGGGGGGRLPKTDRYRRYRTTQRQKGPQDRHKVQQYNSTTAQQPNKLLRLFNLCLQAFALLLYYHMYI